MLAAAHKVVRLAERFAELRVDRLVQRVFRRHGRSFSKGVKQHHVLDPHSVLGCGGGRPMSYGGGDLENGQHRVQAGDAWLLGCDRRGR